jgi:hypothetical protein
MYLIFCTLIISDFNIFFSVESGFKLPMEFDNQVATDQKSKEGIHFPSD